MRNLKLNNCFYICNIKELSGQSSCLSIDFDTGTIFAGAGPLLTHVDHDSGQVLQSLCLTESGYIQHGLYIVCMQHIVDQQLVAVAISDGTILVWDYLSNQMNEVGCFESGVRAMSWSPDQELVVLATGADALVVMTREFDPVTEVIIPSNESIEEKFIKIGWGKRETQFQGSAGKMAAFTKIEPPQPAPPSDDRRTRISWRGDGQMFVVSSINTKTDCRQLTIWSREGTLQHVSETVNGLEHALAWKPSGSLITSTRRLSGQYEVVFFEKNGLRHGQFALLFAEDDFVVRELSWNIDSTLLAIWCDRLLPSDAENKPLTSYMLLYAVGNYHWYLKQTLKFPTDQSISSFCWHPENAYSMHIVCNSGSLMQYTWSWATDCSRGTDAHDLASVAVIDGNKVMLTPFRTMVVPPPYSAYQVTSPSPVNQVAFGPPSRSNDFAILTLDYELRIYSFSNADSTVDGTVEHGCAGGNGFTVACQTPVLAHSIKLPSQCTNGVPLLRHLTWLNDETFIVIGSVDIGHNSVLYKLHLDHSEETAHLTVKNTLPIVGSVFNVCVYNEHLILHKNNGSLFLYNPENQELEDWMFQNRVVRLPQTCTTLGVCTLAEKPVIVGLTDRFRLYVNDLELASNCTSFAIHPEYVLITTLSHTCRCISRQTRFEDLRSVMEKDDPVTENVRRVERGSRIVVSIASDTKVVLQMPRGNLETIHPRALVLAFVRSLLDIPMFGEAFLIMRKHRINLNLLHDHNPSFFFTNLTQFVIQLSDPEHINLFLSDLINDDVTVTMYPTAYGGRVNEVDEGKVDRVCDAIRKVVTEVEPKKYILSVITSYARKTVPELETALTVINSLPVQCDVSELSRGKALSYIICLVDVNKLYDVAMGTYDFDLVLMVAQRSQKDPKEYLPHIKELMQLDPVYQKFAIDKHLKNHKKALTHIAQCPERFDECLTYIHEHSLHADALKLFKPGTEEFRTIADSYGDHLSSRGIHEEAGVMYLKAGQLNKSLVSYEKCGNWRQALCLSTRLEHSREQSCQLSRRLAKYLREQNRHSEAAVVCEHYLKDVEEAIDTLIEGCQWDEAVRLMHTYNRTDFVDTHLRPQLMSSFESHQSTLRTMISDFVKYRDRLAVVRQEKERVYWEMLGEAPSGKSTTLITERLQICNCLPIGFFAVILSKTFIRDCWRNRPIYRMDRGDGDALKGIDDDLFSDAASTAGHSVASSTNTSATSASIHSKSSGRSSRNKRKAERKKWSLKEGSPHEDLALMDALAKIVTYVNSVKDDIRQLLLTMVSYDMDDKAARLQAELRDTSHVIERSTAQIWPQPTAPDSSGHSFGPQTTAESVLRSRQQGRQHLQVGATSCLAPVVSTTKWSLEVLNVNP